MNMARKRTTIPGLAEAIEDRRRQLGLTIGELAEAAGLTRQGLDPLRRGERRSYEDRTIFGIARALRWRGDWYQVISDGGGLEDLPTEIQAVTRPETPARLSDVELVATLRRLTEAVDRLERRLAEEDARRA